MGHLESITSPQDLRTLSGAELDALAAEIRDLMISTVARTSGHLGPNLGVVELTLAIHRVFDSPRDRVVFDTGHQAYVHKLVTGRHDIFDTLRQEGGLSGYPSQAESDHDIVENSHASTSLSYADGLAKAYRVKGENRHVVAVIGDGALTGGMAWEALNNIAIARDSKLVIVVNDNERSYTPTIGGLATALTTLRTNPRYEQVLDQVKRRLNAVPGVGPCGVRSPARREEGDEGRARPAGALRGPRAEVRRPGRRARPRGDGAGAHACQAVRRAGHRARDHPQGLRLRPGRAARGRPVPRARPVRRPDRCGEAEGPHLDRPLLRQDRRDRRAAPRRRGDHRCDDAPGRARHVCRDVSPSAPSTSASPSSTPPRRPQAWRWVACTRSSRSMRPSSTAPSTRC